MSAIVDEMSVTVAVMRVGDRWCAGVTITRHDQEIAKEVRELPDRDSAIDFAEGLLEGAAARVRRLLGKFP